MAEVCAEHSGCKADIEALQRSDEKQWSAIDQLRSRLPNWAVFVLSAYSVAIGYLLAYIQLIK